LGSKKETTNCVGRKRKGKGVREARSNLDKPKNEKNLANGGKPGDGRNVEVHARKKKK